MFSRPDIRFLLFLSVAQQWKYFVFKSLCFKQSTLDRWFHMHSSMSMSFLMLSERTCSWSCPLPAIDATSTSTNSFLCRAKVWRTFPNTFLSHNCSWAWQFSTYLMTFPIQSPKTASSQAECTTPSHLSSLSHMASNRKGFWGQNRDRISSKHNQIGL